jgi:hypothetical protein
MTDGSKDSKAEMELKKIYKRKQLHETSPWLSIWWYLYIPNAHTVGEVDFGIWNIYQDENSMINI